MAAEDWFQEVYKENIKEVLNFHKEKIMRKRW